MKHPLSRNFLLGALGVTAALVAITFARGGGGEPAPIPGSNSSSAGMVAAKDPETGRLRVPTAQEIAALRPGASGKGETQLTSQRLKNGAVVTTLNPSYDLYNVAAKGADGKIQRACVPSYKLEATLKAAQNSQLATTEDDQNEK